MMSDVIRVMKKDFDCEPIIPKNAEFFKDSLVLMSNTLKDLSVKGPIISKGLVLFKKYAFSYLLNLNKKKVNNYLVLNEKSSFLFTCSRIIFEKGVVKKRGRGPNYLVMNENLEVLGVAIYEKSGLKNRVNIGYYLKQNDFNEPIF